MKRQLTCTCCGGDAGRWEQFHNQDTGYGLCAPCASWIAGRAMPEDEMARTYGVAGVHREVPTHVVHGLRFKVLASFTNTQAGEAQANAFMVRNPSASVLDVTGARVILADVADKGVPA